MTVVAFALGVFATFLLLLLLSLRALFYVCPPNRVLIFSGTRRRVGDKRVGYRILKGGNMLRRPFIERVDALDLTNMIIELNASGAYARGGVPLNVQGVANLKVAGHEPVLNNAIERFLGKSRVEIVEIAKATLEGSLRGVLATLTPEQINEDRNLFNERLVQEVEQDMTALGLVVDSLKIQNITDDVSYLDSLGRSRNADLLASARVAEAQARADAEVNAAENLLKETQAQVTAQLSVVKADAERRLTEVRSLRGALVAEEQAAVAALLAQAESDMGVQRARIEQVRNKLEADVIAPARADRDALEQQAIGKVAPILEEGRARADAIIQLSEAWAQAGEQGREILLLQRLEPVIRQLTATIADTKVDRLTMIGGGPSTLRLVGMNEQIKEVFGIDLVEKLRALGAPVASPATAPLATELPEEPEEPPRKVDGRMPPKP